MYVPNPSVIPSGQPKRGEAWHPVSSVSDAVIACLPFQDLEGKTPLDLAKTSEVKEALQSPETATV